MRSTSDRSVPTTDQSRRSRWEGLGRGGSAAVLLLLGGALVVGGAQAIRAERLKVAWRTVQGVGPLGRVQRGAGILTGEDAVREGIGLVAVGGAVTAWGVGLLAAGGATGRSPVDRPIRVLEWVSLLGLAVAGVVFFPPWRLWTVGFYGVALGASAAIAWALWGTPRASQVRGVFTGLVGLVIAVAWFSPDVSGGMVAGLFAATVGWALLAEVVPVIHRRLALLEEQPSVKPRTATDPAT